MCGEQHKLRPFYQHYLGSPPRVRGTAQKAMEMGLFEGITPACAGNSFMAYSSAMLTQDHPRVCGEQHTLATTAGGAGGSPPRVRGTAQKNVSSSHPARITPACAGNSGCAPQSIAAGWDHPRVCGEQIMTDRKSIRRLGSPPRVRGTGTSIRRGSRHSRITPACAGNRPRRQRRQSW